LCDAAAAPRHWQPLVASVRGTQLKRRSHIAAFSGALHGVQQLEALRLRQTHGFARHGKHVEVARPQRPQRAFVRGA
jgi:hypothetical protein